MDEFLWRAALGGIGVALISAPLGCFVVWRRMAYFGETIAHSALLGVALGFLAGVNLTLAVFAMAVVVAGGLRLIDRETKLAKDTALGLLAHVVLAVGLITVSLVPSMRVDLMGLLFGDILAIGWDDVALVFGVGAVILLIVKFMWNDLLSISVDKELAGAEGVEVELVEFKFSVLIAATIALAIKLVGLLLVTAMLIIPAAAAMHQARTPEQMVVLAIIVSVLSVAAGLAGSLFADVPAGPAIVASMAVFFLLFSAVKRA